MSATAIRAQGLGKRYRLGETHGGRFRYRSLRETLASAVSGRWGRSRGDGDAATTLWALRDLSFAVEAGETLGIVGRNGAGKSTLLKILARITDPTEGHAEIRGRVGSLLEVGTGFHPELTGRENVFLNGAILGMRRAEIRRKFDEIVAFAELERFLETPVKRYSSGMYMRLAFAVAAHLEPEILLVDEVLAVGDAEFQKKCLGKMDDVARGGRTVVFVSHNLQAVRGLCRTGLLLRSGRLERFGAVDEVVDAYLASLADASASRLDRSWDDPETAPGNDRIRLHRVALSAADDRSDAGLGIDRPLRLDVWYWNRAEETPLVLNLALYGIDGTLVFVSLSTTDAAWHGRAFPPGLYHSVCHLPANLLAEGTYRIRLLFLDTSARHLYDQDEALVFTLHERQERGLEYFGRWQGLIRPSLSWTTERIA